MVCDFCERCDDLPDRIFYDKKDYGWFAFLSAPPHTQGHSIVAAYPRDGQCPRDLSLPTLSGVDVALSEVIQALRQCYAPHISDVLLASLRGSQKHFHIHLIPVWAEELEAWRHATGYRDSHLMEFLGALEKKHDFGVLQREAKEKMSVLAQRRESADELSGEVQPLRHITGYDPAH